MLAASPPVAKMFSPSRTSSSERWTRNIRRRGRVLTLNGGWAWDGATELTEFDDADRRQFLLYNLSGTHPTMSFVVNSKKHSRNKLKNTTDSFHFILLNISSTWRRFVSFRRFSLCQNCDEPSTLHDQYTKSTTSPFEPSDSRVLRARIRSVVGFLVRSLRFETLQFLLQLLAKRIEFEGCLLEISHIFFNVVDLS